VRPVVLALLFSGAAALATPAAAGSFVVGAPGDEAAIRAIRASRQETVAGHRAADLDWENAFGIRYDDRAKREALELLHDRLPGRRQGTVSRSVRRNSSCVAKIGTP
jgi:hypothetical protein